MKTSTSEGKHGIRWTVQNQLDDLNFSNEVDLLSPTHQQMQMKRTSVAASTYTSVKSKSSNATRRISTQSHLMEKRWDR
ncbi:unnamed protein product [Schistosoma margrebowiei]|uniref:Uncharacterized protein n=1 Tax=Schistosoma margrebowiei TaxID=48269 RepID=A0A183LHN5_9TREM|nr:unnamed protein product [Schistosoma margrebowiei]